MSSEAWSDCRGSDPSYSGDDSTSRAGDNCGVTMLPRWGPECSYGVVVVAVVVPPRKGMGAASASSSDAEGGGVSEVPSS